MTVARLISLLYPHEQHFAYTIGVKLFVIIRLSKAIVYATLILKDLFG